MGRLQVQFFWQNGNTQWARMGTPHAGPDRGMMMMPEVGIAISISLKALERARVPVLALSIASILGFGCRAEQDAQVANKRATTDSAKKGSTVNPQIDLKVDTGNRHVMVYVTWKNTSDTDTFFLPHGRHCVTA